MANPTQVEAATKKGFQKINGKAVLYFAERLESKRMAYPDAERKTDKKYYFDKKDRNPAKRRWKTINGYPVLFWKR